MPLKGIDAEAMQKYAGQIVFVLDTGDVRAQQACVRLSKVLAFNVRLVSREDAADGS